MAVTKPIEGYTRLLELTDDAPVSSGAPDDRSGACYLADGELVLATEIALATGRPLLLRGWAGSGKSSWAPYVARNLGWSYYERTLTSDTELSDLFARYDAVRRLQDAHVRVEQDADKIDLSPERYVTPGPLWLAFDAPGASQIYARRSGAGQPWPDLDANSGRDPSRAVVLLDEIDKADPNLPNGLLEVLAVRKFFVESMNRWIERRKPDAAGATRRKGKSTGAMQPNVNDVADLLIVFTTNEERDLPEPFLRRCVVHQLPDPDVQRLFDIALLRHQATQDEPPDVPEAYRFFAEVTVAAREQARKRDQRGPSAAEFLDLCAAWHQFRFRHQENSNLLLRALETLFQKTADKVMDLKAAVATARDRLAKGPL